jgi:hypothetical protein
MSLSGRSETYKGFLITPCVFRADDSARLWSIGVFVRTEKQTPDQNRYFQLKGIFADSRLQAFERSLAYAKELIDQDVVSLIEYLTNPMKIVAGAQPPETEPAGERSVRNSDKQEEE